MWSLAFHHSRWRIGMVVKTHLVPAPCGMSFHECQQLTAASPAKGCVLVSEETPAGRVPGSPTNEASSFWAHAATLTLRAVLAASAAVWLAFWHTTQTLVPCGTVKAHPC